MRNRLLNDPCVDLQELVTPSECGAGCDAPSTLTSLPNVNYLSLLPSYFVSLAQKLHQFGVRSLKSTFLTGFCIFPFRLKAFIQWLSMVDILNSAVQAIICHAEIELDEMTN